MALVNTTKEEFENEDIRKSVAKLVGMLDLDPDSSTLFHFKSNPELTTIRIPIEKELQLCLGDLDIPPKNDNKCAIFEIRYDYDKYRGYQFTGWHFLRIENC